MRFILSAAAAATLASASFAEDGLVTYTTTDAFDDVVFGLESAILDKGLVVDSISHIGEMLERTRADVGSDKVLFSAAEAYQFCAASLSRKVMEADLMNIRFCPYTIFVSQLDGKDEVTVGFRTYPEGPMKEVQALLDDLARSAIGE